MSLCSHIIHAYIHPCHGSLGRSGYVSAVPDTAKKIKKQSLFCRHPIPEPAMRHPKIVQNSPSPWHWSCSRNIHRKRSCQRNAKHKKQKTSELKIFYYALQQKKRGSSFHPPRGTFLTYETISLHQWTKPNWSKNASWLHGLLIFVSLPDLPVKGILFLHDGESPMIFVDLSCDRDKCSAGQEKMNHEPFQQSILFAGKIRKLSGSTRT